MNVSPAGVYDFALGGTENTEDDRHMVERAKQVMPHIVLGAWANRGFLQRAVSRLSGDWGITQFIDLGSGFPTQRNTHEVVAERNPDARVVYVDVDPRVVAKSRELLAGSEQVTAIRADVRQPAAILNDPELRRLIDFDKPVAVLLVAVTHFLSDDDNPWRIVEEFMAAVPSGSYLVLSAVTSDRQEEAWDQVLRTDRRYEGFPRTRAEVDRFFTGLDIVPPYEGAKPEVAYIGLWGAEDPDLADDDGSRLAYAAVARKP
jgi:S-adenosyl methyltransferase